MEVKVSQILINFTTLAGHTIIATLLTNISCFLQFDDNFLHYEYEIPQLV